MINLEDLPIFNSLPKSELNNLASALSIIHAPAGTIICHEGEPGHSFYIIRDGLIEVVKDVGTADEKVLTDLGAGDYVGEMSLLSREGLRNASVKAKTDANLWEMTHKDFDDLMSRFPKPAYELMRDLSQRLNQTQNNIIEDLRLKNAQLETAYEALKAAQAQIIEKEKMERELQLAHEIQMSLLPGVIPHLQGYDIGAKIESARQVGGDLYNFIPLDGGKMGILIGDVTDKGVPAAIFMAQVQAMFRAEARRKAPMCLILDTVNSLLMEKNEQGFFVTALYGVLDPDTNTFSYVRAGHEIPILCSIQSGAKFLPLVPGQPLGIFQDPILEDSTVEIPSGSALVLYTDGLTEGQDSNFIQFQENQLLDQVCTNVGLSAQEMCDRLMQTVIDYREGMPLQDDVTLVVIKRIQ